MTAAQAPLPYLGTWKMTKCEPLRPDLPHPVSGITVTTQENDGIHLNSEATWSDGRVVKMNLVYQMDGKWYPVTGSPIADSVSVQRLDDRSAEAKLRKGGVDVGTNRSTVSADGRTLTAQVEMVGPGGTAIGWTTTSARQ